MSANLTKKALSDSIKHLMHTTPFEKISIKQICEQCGINRKSFYYHFKDKHDLVEWIFYTEFMRCINNPKNENSWDYIKGICEFIYEDKDFYINAFNIYGQNSFVDMFNENISMIASEYLGEVIIDSKLNEFYCSFFGDGIRCAIVRWLKDDKGMDVDEFVSLLQSLEKILIMHMTNNEQKNF